MPSATSAMPAAAADIAMVRGRRKPRRRNGRSTKYQLNQASSNDSAIRGGRRGQRVEVQRPGEGEERLMPQVGAVGDEADPDEPTRAEHHADAVPRARQGE